MYHHHSLTSITDGNNDSNASGTYNDSYHSTTSGGCFTTPVYKTHQHTSACGQRTCGGTRYHIGNWQSQCSTCGAIGFGEENQSYPCTNIVYACGKSSGTRYESEGIDYYIKSCGYVDKELIGATITY